MHDRRDGQEPRRLRKRAEFLSVRKGEKRRGQLFLVETLDRGDREAPRYGLTVTRKVGNAAVRNRIRRRLREAIRVGTGLGMEPGRDYVIVARRDVLAAPFALLQHELSRRVGRAD